LVTEGGLVPARHGRAYDIVVLGVTGFSGALTAEYLAANAPDDCRWAIAGRSVEKLQSVRQRLAVGKPALADLPVLAADLADTTSLTALAEAARVVVTTVGPYAGLGEPLVAACAEAGTDYVDLSGEPEFIDRVYVASHDRAVATGARIVHACGFDSVPYDLGALFTVKQLPAGVPLRLRGVMRAGGALSGGTFHSAVGQFARVGDVRRARDERRKVEKRPEGRRARGTGRGRPRRDDELGYWLMPMPTIDATVVKRSAMAREDYGPDFSYQQYWGFKRLPQAAVTAAGVAGVVAAAQLPPLRELMLKAVPQGQGPSPEKRERSWFTLDIVGEGGGRRVLTRVSGGDPGYGETAKMVAESALSLAFDDNPVTAGQVTTAQAMGESLTDRLTKAGISITLVRNRP
jgi:short subunit dehydrogenase-like uncharacterized protein